MSMIRVTDKQYEMNQMLISHLNTVIYNLQKDFDFVIAVTGTGLLRVGKSMLAQQMAYYISFMMGVPFTLDNLVFSGKQLRPTAMKLPMNSCLIYDEARESLDAKKTMHRISIDLQDFFSECGMLNDVMFLVMPDFFEMTKRIAITRSEFLVNVSRDGEIITIRSHKDKLPIGTEVLSYTRGGFQLWGRKKKKSLYKKGKEQNDNYDAVKPDCWGEFRPFWILDPNEYTVRKRKFMARERDDEYKKPKHDIAPILMTLCEHMTQREAAIELGKNGFNISQSRINQLIGEYRGRTRGI